MQKEYKKKKKTMMNYITPGGVLKKETQPRESESYEAHVDCSFPPFYKVRTMKGKGKRGR